VWLISVMAEAAREGAKINTGGLRPISHGVPSAARQIQLAFYELKPTTNGQQTAIISLCLAAFWQKNYPLASRQHCPAPANPRIHSHSPPRVPRPAAHLALPVALPGGGVVNILGQLEHGAHAVLRPWVKILQSNPKSAPSASRLGQLTAGCNPSWLGPGYASSGIAPPTGNAAQQSGAGATPALAAVGAIPLPKSQQAARCLAHAAQARRTNFRFCGGGYAIEGIRGSASWRRWHPHPAAPPLHATSMPTGPDSMQHAIGGGHSITHAIGGGHQHKQRLGECTACSTDWGQAQPAALTWSSG
jgi:hypothetical protein